MNAYFFKMTNEERTNILDQHKEIYDGYVTQYANTNEQPLYVQDLANDKNGITVNNRGEVGTYRNTGINEMKHDGKNTGLFSGETTEDSIDEMELDTIGDGPDDLENGTVDFEDYDNDIFDDMDDIEIVSIHEQLDKSLDMFKRFKKY
jgi:hypothetical protein